MRARCTNLLLFACLSCLPLPSPASPSPPSSLPFSLSPPFWTVNDFTGEPQLQATFVPRVPARVPADQEADEATGKLGASVSLRSVSLRVAAQNAEGLPFLGGRAKVELFGDELFGDGGGEERPDGEPVRRRPLLAISLFRGALAFPMRNTTDYVHRVGLGRRGALVKSEREVKRMGKRARGEYRGIQVRFAEVLSSSFFPRVFFADSVSILSSPFF